METLHQNQLHPVDAMLPANKLFAYGLQHVLAMYSGAVAVPIILAQAIHLPTDMLIHLINADLFTCGIATLIQTLGFWKIGARIPMIQGVTFAAVTPMCLIAAEHGLPTMYGAIILAGLFTFLIAPFFSRFIRFFPPVVTGTIIMIIGITLLPVSIVWIGGGGDTHAATFAGPMNLFLAAITLAIVITLYRYGKGFISNISVLIGLIGGTIIATVLGQTNFDAVSRASWVNVVTPFTFGFPVFDVGSIISMIIVMFVTMVETTGDCIAIGEIVDKPIKKADLSRCLRADGLSTFIGGIFNSFPYTAFAQNVGLIALTRVKSRFVVACIPNSVLGGAGIAMFGMIIASGVRSLSKVDFEHSSNLMLVAISIGVSMITLTVPNFFHAFPDWSQIILHSGITLGSICAVVLNILFNGIGKKEEEE